MLVLYSEPHYFLKIFLGFYQYWGSLSYKIVSYKKKECNDETFNQNQVRRSERIKKRIVNINPEDIGENDNENDEDYKWLMDN